MRFIFTPQRNCLIIKLNIKIWRFIDLLFVVQKNKIPITINHKFDNYYWIFYKIIRKEDVFFYD